MPYTERNGSEAMQGKSGNEFMQKRKGAAVLAALSGVPFIMVLGNSMIIPVLPDIKAGLDLSDFETGLIITLFSVPAGLIIPLAGFLSDRFGRKVVIVPSLIVYGLGGVAAGLAGMYMGKAAYAAILGGRILQGIGAAGTAPIAMALCGDLFTGKERSKSLGIIEAANGLGKVVSPVLGSLVGLIAWYATFLFFPAVVVPIILALWLLVREPGSNRSRQDVKQYLQSIRQIFEKKMAMLLTSFLAGMSVLLILFGVLFFLSEYLESRYNLKGVTKGLALAIPVIFMSAASFATGTLIKKRLKLMKWSVSAGLALIAVSLAAMGIFDRSTLLFFTAVSAAGVGTGLTLPCLNTIIISSCQAQKRGLITSLYGSVRFFGVALGPPVFGLLMGHDRSVMFWSAATLAGMAFLLATLLISVRDMEDPATPKAPAFVYSPARKPDTAGDSAKEGNREKNG